LPHASALLFNRNWSKLDSDAIRLSADHSEALQIAVSTQHPDQRSPARLGASPDGSALIRQ
jgi:hypothetical protein